MAHAFTSDYCLHQQHEKCNQVAHQLGWKDGAMRCRVCSAHCQCPCHRFPVAGGLTLELVSCVNCDGHMDERMTLPDGAKLMHCPQCHRIDILDPPPAAG